MGGDAVKRVIGTSLGAAALLAAFSALAQPSQDWVWCENKDNAFAPDVSINGCSALIQSGTVSPQNIPIVYNNRGVAYRVKGDLDRAIADYSEAIKLDPDYEVAYHNRGRAYFAKREIDRAITDYDQALRINPRYRFAYRQSWPRLLRQTRCRSRNCRLRRSHQDRSHLRLRLQPSRPRLPHHGRLRPGDCRPHRGDQARPQFRDCLLLPRLGMGRQQGTGPRHRRLRPGAPAQSPLSRKRG